MVTVIRAYLELAILVERNKKAYTALVIVLIGLLVVGVWFFTGASWLTAIGVAGCIAMGFAALIFLIMFVAVAMLLG